MNRWLILVGVALIVFWVWTCRSSEGFTTENADVLRAQRQALQWEGERRYNDFAQLQSPALPLSPDDVDAAFVTQTAVPSARTSSLTSLLAAVGLGGRRPDTAGSSLEQTGQLASKIAQCEALSVNCGAPLPPECGICHVGGTNAAGQPHRGGLFISSEDQIRAGTTGTYRPTIGTCAPENFTMTATACQQRESQLACLQAGGPSSSNSCAQCYGAPPGTGLVFVGQKPRTFTANLWISHAGLGSYGNNLVGMSIQVAGAPVVNVGRTTLPFLSPNPIPLTGLTEGATMTITIYGAPAFWCGWLASPDGKRVVSLDVGVQSVSPANAFTVAGDSRSAPVTAYAATHDTATWATFAPTIPNTVLWFQRRNDVVPGAVLSAWYGTQAQGQGQGQGRDVTEIIKMAAAAQQTITVGNDAFGGDPQPGQSKFLWITTDTGATSVHRETEALPPASNIVQFTVTVPATLVDPAFSDDVARCPTGPLIFTAGGAGLMGSHSCYAADGSFNPTQYCLQELWRAAGGTSAGTGFPNTDAKVAALVVGGSLDATVASLNTQGSIALYGSDMNGKVADFATRRAAAMFMLGKDITNPCQNVDGSQTGPFSPACHDFLWRTSTSPSTPYSADLPYAACNASGAAAPLGLDGTPNAAAIAAATAAIQAAPSVAALRGYYAQLYARTQDPSNFETQASAMRDCFGVTVAPASPTPTPSECPMAVPVGSVANVRSFLTPSSVWTFLGYDKGDVIAVAPSGAGAEQRFTINLSSAYPGFYVFNIATTGAPVFARHSGANFVAATEDGSDQLHRNAAFSILPGLADATNGVSFVSMDAPGAYIVQSSNGVVALATSDGSTAFAQSATWYVGVV